MLSSPDLALVRRDTALPGLATLLDPDALLALLQRHAIGRGPFALRVTYVRYKPGENCVAAFTATAGNGATALGYAKAYRQGQQAKIERAGLRAERAGTWGIGRFGVEDPLLTVCCFPNDDKLPTLLRLTSEEGRYRLLRDILPDAPTQWDAQVNVVRYKPERRLVGCLRAMHAPVAAIRCYTPRGFGRARQAQRSLHSAITMRVAALLGKSRRRSVMALEWLPGVSFDDALASQPSIDVVEQVGIALAELHAQPCETMPDRRLETEAAEWTAAADSLQSIHPAAGARSGALVRLLASRLPTTGGSRLVHGDFYAQQVVIDGARVGVIDLDRAGQGEAALDLGTFIAHLERDALIGLRRRHDVDAMSAALLAGYRSAGGLVAERTVRLYSAAGLLRLASEPFRMRKPDWTAETEALVARADALAGAAARTVIRPVCSPRGPSPVTDPYGASLDSSFPTMRRALDPRIAEDALQPVAESQGAATLVVRAIRVARHKPGKRCLIEYDVELLPAATSPVVITLLGKLRARGVDSAAAPLLAVLRARGFGDDASDGVSVPAPVGTLPELGMWLQRKVAGSPATPLLAGEGGPTLGARIALALSKLHRANVPARKRHSIADEVEILRDRLGYVAREQPQYASRIRRVLDGCARLAASLPPPNEQQAIHRDFYSDQLLVSSDRLYLLDFDLYCAGDPALDAGNFLGHVIEQSLRTFGDAQPLSAVAAAFAEEFLRDADAERRHAVRVYTALTVARQIYISTLFPERQSVMQPLLEWCEARLDPHGPGLRSRSGHRVPNLE